MKTASAACLSVALLIPLATLVAAGSPNAGQPTRAPAQNVPATRPAGPANGGELAALERKLLGTWKGGPCAGDYTFNADGTFECRHFTPGGNTLTGTWSLRWDALPPTLVLTCRTSDFRKKEPARAEYAHLGRALEVKLLELTSDSLVLRFPSDRHDWRGSRPAAE